MSFNSGPNTHGTWDVPRDVFSSVVTARSASLQRNRTREGISNAARPPLSLFSRTEPVGSSSSSHAGTGSAGMPKMSGRSRKAHWSACSPSLPTTHKLGICVIPIVRTLLILIYSLTPNITNRVLTMPSMEPRTPDYIGVYGSRSFQPL